MAYVNKRGIKLNKMRRFYRSGKGAAARVQAYAGRKYRRSK